MKKTIKEYMTNETVITVLAIIAVLLTLVMIYYGWILALVVGCAILGAATVEALVVFGVYYGVKGIIERRNERISRKESR